MQRKDGLFVEYSDDYFSDEERQLIYACRDLVESIRSGEFEHDTALADNILWTIRFFVNKINI